MNQKNKEIEYLKGELHRSHLERKDALDIQRLELTKTYEALLQSKDDEFLQKENEISQQVVKDLGHILTSFPSFLFVSFSRLLD